MLFFTTTPRKHLAMSGDSFARGRGRTLLAPSGWRLGMPLSLPQCARQYPFHSHSQRRIISSKRQQCQRWPGVKHTFNACITMATETKINTLLEIISITIHSLPRWLYLVNIYWAPTICQALYTVLLILSLVWGKGVLAGDWMERLVWELLFLPTTIDTYGLLQCNQATSGYTLETRNGAAGTRKNQVGCGTSSTQTIFHSFSSFQSSLKLA